MKCLALNSPSVTFVEWRDKTNNFNCNDNFWQKQTQKVTEAERRASQLGEGGGDGNVCKIVSLKKPLGAWTAEGGGQASRENTMSKTMGLRKGMVCRSSDYQFTNVGGHHALTTYGQLAATVEHETAPFVFRQSTIWLASELKISFSLYTCRTWHAGSTP